MDESNNIENLSDQYKRNIYKVPEGYFDDLSGKILKKCFVKPNFYPLFFQTFYFKTAIAICSILIIIFIGKNRSTMEDIKNEMNYIEQLNSIDTKDFFSSYQFSESDVIELYNSDLTESDSFFSILNITI